MNVCPECGEPYDVVRVTSLKYKRYFIWRCWHCGEQVNVQAGGTHVYTPDVNTIETMAWANRLGNWKEIAETNRYVAPSASEPFEPKVYSFAPSDCK